jgi:hypothetical protein
MSSLVEIHPPECEQCIKPTPAQFELRDSRNALRGAYCEKHGPRAMAKLHAQETAGLGVTGTMPITGGPKAA